MDKGIWELRKSFEGLGNDEEKAAILAGSRDGGPVSGEPVKMTKMGKGPSAEGDTASKGSNTVLNGNDGYLPLENESSLNSDVVPDMHANLDLSLGDQLDNLETDDTTLNSTLAMGETMAEPQKYSPKLSIEDSLDRICAPKQLKQSSDCNQRSAISANLTDFNSANAAASQLPNNKKDSSLRESLSSLISERSGTVISCHNVSYQVKVPGKKRCQCGGLKERKFILKDVCGLFKPGLNAILGPTGSGKSSLLDVIAGRKDPRGQSGQVLLNGGSLPSNFKCMAGYVIQDDIVQGMLTVRENIEFSAALRLPAALSQEKRRQRVDDVIAELGLTKCADTRVGTEFRRGISGGERKRTNIGMELITSPSVLFLDEPTTGLDANTAYSVMHTLQRLSRRGKTILFSIHQPRYHIFKLFDSMMLLSHGECLYQGPARDALPYFQTVGYKCEEHENPGDFFLDILRGGVQPFTLPADDNTSKLKPNGVAAENEIIVDIEEEVPDEDTCLARQRLLVQQFRKSDVSTRLVDELKPLYLDFEKSEVNNTLVKQRVQYPTSWCKQLAVVGSRTFRNMVRNPHTLATQLLTALILGLIVGTIYFQTDNSYRSGIQNRVGAFFFIVMNYVFGNMAAVDIFIRERALFIHENVSGFYRMSVYFLAKLTCDVFPNKALPILLFSTITYWMIGLVPSFVHFVFFLVNTCLTALAGTGVALLFSATVNNHTIGTLLTSVVWVFMMVFSGLLVNVDTIPAGLRWMKYLSIFRYSMNGYTINELKDAEFCDGSKTSSFNSTQAADVCDYGNSYMERQGISYQTSWDLWLNELALFLIALVFLVLTYIQLRRIQKHR